MKTLFLGDIVGKSGKEAIKRHLPQLISEFEIDFTVINVENAANGFGVTKKICHDLFDYGADALTLGNHAFDNDEVFTFIDHEPRLIRPCNYPKGTPGKGASCLTGKNGEQVLVINVLGRVFMQPFDCPFISTENQIGEAALGREFDATILDIHAEASAEKQAIGRYFDGRVTLAVGTHTHVPTADARVLPKGSAYMTDAGMCGDYDSVIGMKANEPIRRFVTGLRSKKYEPADGGGAVCGVIVESDPATGLARSVRPVRRGRGIENI